MRDEMVHESVICIKGCEGVRHLSLSSIYESMSVLCLPSLIASYTASSHTLPSSCQVPRPMTGINTPLFKIWLREREKNG